MKNRCVLKNPKTFFTKIIQLMFFDLSINIISLNRPFIFFTAFKSLYNLGF